MGDALYNNQWVGDLAVEVLARQARARTQQTSEAFEEALKAVLETEAGRQRGELRDGPFRNKGAQQWQQDLPLNRAEERSRARREERKQAQQEDNRRTQLASWKAFMQEERRELERRKDGQLA